MDSDVDPEKMNLFLEVLDRQFGGSTPLGVVSGRWVAPDGATVAEPMLRVEVSVKKSQLGEFERVARLIGRETKQHTIYVVENFQAETRFLLIDEDGDAEETGTGQ